MPPSNHTRSPGIAPSDAAPPAVSVVMPVHNGEPFLQEAVDSILGQTFGDFELIVVDDGSTDGTAAILADAGARDARVRVHRLPRNLGVTAALNAGCRLARAALIARMDADDISLPDRLDTQVAFLRDHPQIAVVGSWVRLIDEGGRLGAVKSYPTEPPLVAWALAFFNTLAHPTVLMRRDVLEMAAVYDPGYPRAEDYALFTRLSRTELLANVPRVLLHYRAWPGNSSRNPEQDRQAARVVSAHAEALGVAVSCELAGTLQGLARDRYPATAEQIRAAARAIVDLHGAIGRRSGGPSAGAQVSRDAAVRLWLLAALSARRSPTLAVSLAATAVKLSPAATGTFLKKVAGRAFGAR